ncbi:MAG: transcriptional regulator [Flavobacteriaceae bacterium]|nr:transcriptional regulator [Flavobacteriaceae bacterium]
MLSNATQYAVRSVLYLALYSNSEQRIRVQKISEDLGTPQPFVAKLLQKLSSANLVSSVKGPHGGFYLNEENRNTTLWDVILTIDGPDKFHECFLGLAKCSDANPCPLHFSVAPFKTHIREDLKKTISQFSEAIKEQGTHLSLKQFDPLANNS